MKKRRGMLLFCLAGVIVALCPFIGGRMISLGTLFSKANPVDYTVLWQLRIPRVLAGFLAGSGLAVAGMVVQALFNNPLASPYTLGVSSGAALGAVICIRTGFVLPFLSYQTQSVSAFAGSMLAVACIYGLARIKRSFAPVTLLIAGVAMSFFFGAVNLFIHYTSPFLESVRVVHWMAGSLEAVSYTDVMTLLPVYMVCLFTIMLLRDQLDLLMIGDDLAAGRGGDPQAIRRFFLLVTSVLVGAVVSVCGPVGFIGLMVPHAARLLFGSGHRLLFFASLILGGLFFVVCDTIGRTFFYPVELPVGILCALAGGPFFIWLVMRKSYF